MDSNPGHAASRRRWYRFLVPLVAVVAGLGSAWLAVRSAQQSPVPQSPWEVNLLAGSPDADPYTRARVALNGLLALSPQETLYYIARHDSAGRALRAACRYRISGVPPDARWWSITAYGEDLYLFRDPQRRHSVDATGLPGARFSFETGPSEASGFRDPAVPWLPTPGEGGLVLTLRLYQPSVALAAQPLALRPPQILRRGACP
jgi:hypothetical protein